MASDLDFSFFRFSVTLAICWVLLRIFVKAWEVLTYILEDTRSALSWNKVVMYRPVARVTDLGGAHQCRRVPPPFEKFLLIYGELVAKWFNLFHLFFPYICISFVCLYIFIEVEVLRKKREKFSEGRKTQWLIRLWWLIMSHGTYHVWKGVMS